MSCTFFFPIMLALFFTSYATGALHAAGRTEGRDLMPIALVGITFPGWMLIVHISVLWLLAGFGHGLDLQARSEQMLEPMPVAITTFVCGLIVAAVIHLDLRNKPLTGWLLAGAGVAGGVATLGPAGMWASIVAWHACAMTGFHVWKKGELRRRRDATKCPRCGYAFGGVAVRRCPECGHKVYRPGDPESPVPADDEPAAEAGASS
jgi:DNA-directed RNA polymerase subunit RPC12/RpoP